MKHMLLLYVFHYQGEMHFCCHRSQIKWTTPQMYDMTLITLLYCFSFRRRRQRGKTSYVKSVELPEGDKMKQREKWKAASSAYRERKKMANAVRRYTAVYGEHFTGSV